MPQASRTNEFAPSAPTSHLARTSRCSPVLASCPGFSSLTHLRQLHLEGPGIDLGQQISFVNELPLLKRHLTLRWERHPARLQELHDVPIDLEFVFDQSLLRG